MGGLHNRNCSTVIDQLRRWLLTWHFFFENIPQLWYRLFFISYFCFVALAALAFHDGNQANPLDRHVTAWAYSIPALRHGWAEFLTKLGDTQVVTKICWLSTIVLLLINRWHYVPVLLVGVLGEIEVNRWLKLIVGRGRPECPDVPEITGFGFPRGHVSAAAALYGFWILFVICECKPRIPRYVIACIFIVPILIVAVTRITLIAHWLTDVLGAIFFAISWLLFWFWTNHKMRQAASFSGVMRHFNS